jgi:hypothetical protein
MVMSPEHLICVYSLGGVVGKLSDTQKQTDRQAFVCCLVADLKAHCCVHKKCGMTFLDTALGKRKWFTVLQCCGVKIPCT